MIADPNYLGPDGDRWATTLGWFFLGALVTGLLLLGAFWISPFELLYVAIGSAVVAAGIAARAGRWSLAFGILVATAFVASYRIAIEVIDPFAGID